MIFNQLEFLFLFLPIVILATSVPFLRHYRMYSLFAASIIFYGISGIDHAIVLCVEIVWVWIIAKPFSFIRLWLSILGPAIALVYFKYTGFLFSPFNSDTNSDNGLLLPFLNDIALPAGISFFTFQIIGYAVDRYRGEERPRLLDFALFVSFFPQLVAGPIVRLHQVREQIALVASYRLSADQFQKVVVYFSIGLILKVGFADSLARFLDRIGDNPAELSALAAWLGAFAYSFRIYFDFFGYSLIAIGLALSFGIRLPDNFDRPYNALNPRDFWRRWHISLSYWIRDYLYLSLGGNRKYLRNIIIVFVVCGLWHGAAWTFIAWGVYHAFLVITYSLFSDVWDKWPTILQWLLTFVAVTVGWIFFQYDFNNSGKYILSLFGAGGSLYPVYWGDAFLLVISFGITIFLKPNWVYTSIRREGFIGVISQISLASLLGVCMFGIQDSQTFIYFRF